MISVHKQALLIGAFGLVFTLAGGAFAWVQADALIRYEPVQATVHGTDIERVDSQDSVTYKPIVDYSYEVGGVEHRSDAVTPVGGRSSDRGWARRIVGRFEVGETTRAYYDPQAPGDSFLIRQMSFLPYLFVLVGAVPLVVAIFLGAGVMDAGGTGEVTPDPSPSGDGAVELAAANDGRASGAYALASFVWWGLAALGFGHYAAIAPEIGGFEIVTALVYGLVGAALTRSGLQARRIDRALGTPTVRVEPHPFQLGGRAEVEIRIPTFRQLHFERLDLAVVGVDPSDDGRSERRLEFSLLDEPREQPQGEFTTKATLALDFGDGESDVGGENGLHWSLELEIQTDDTPEYAAEFPLEVTSEDAKIDASRTW